MIKCPVCSNLYSDISKPCPDCDFIPRNLDGFIIWSPNEVGSNDSYNPEIYDVLATNESKNFWFKQRNRLIVWILSKVQPGIARYMEVGCGTGFVLSGISEEFPDADLYGSEIHISGLRFASERVPAADFMQLDATKMPYVSEFDAIGAFDVIEHIEDDETVLEGIYQALADGGHVVLTVPQHMWLWSQSDEIAHHKRRYSREELVEKLENAGFRIEYSTSFMMMLLPVMLLSRLVAKRVDGEANHEISPPGPLNFLFNALLGTEIWLIQKGLKLPAGGSLLMVARKSTTNA